MEERVKRLMSTVKCGHCGQPYQSQNVRVLGQTNGLWYINAYCTACHSQFVIAATLSNDAPVLTNDLTEEEATRFNKSISPNVDDVLDMYSFLKDFNGDFGTLFRRQRVGG